VIEFPASVIEDLPNTVEWLVPATFLQAEYEWISVRLIVTPSRVMIYDLKGTQKVSEFTVSSRVFSWNANRIADTDCVGGLGPLDSSDLRSCSSGCDARQCTGKLVSDWRKGSNRRFSRYLEGLLFPNSEWNIVTNIC
jgi:hypothetical protein